MKKQATRKPIGYTEVNTGHIVCALHAYPHIDIPFYGSSVHHTCFYCKSDIPANRIPGKKNWPPKNNG